MTLEDIDFQRRLLHIHHTKFKKSRDVPLSPSTAHHLAAYLRRRRRVGPISPQSPAFVSVRGTSLSHSAFTTAFLAILRKLGVRGPPGQRGARIHDSRHTFSVNRLTAWYRSGVKLFAKRAGVSESVVRDIIGHESEIVSRDYTHVDEETKRTAISRLPNVLLTRRAGSYRPQAARQSSRRRSG